MLRNGFSSAHRRASRLAAYLAAGSGASTLGISAVEAAIITIDIGPTGVNIAGINAGLQPGERRDQPFPTPDQYWLGLFNNYTDATGAVTILGLAMGPTAGIAFTGGYASPRNFASGELIDAAANFTSDFLTAVFRVQYPYGTLAAPDFGPNSFIGFRTSGGSFGWLEVTWSQAAAEFQILAGAYESEPGVGIRAGQAVPEPATNALAALALGGGAYARWRRRRAQNPAQVRPLTAGS
jgi:hypothetical protein